MDDKLKYVSTIIGEELKAFTMYDQYKSKIDEFTGRDNLDFPIRFADVSEYVIRITMLDDSCIYLPIFATDGQGYRHDKIKGYSTIHRPGTIMEAAERKEKRAKVQQKEAEHKEVEHQSEEQRAEMRAKHAAKFEKAKRAKAKKDARTRRKKDRQGVEG